MSKMVVVFEWHTIQGMRREWGQNYRKNEIASAVQVVKRMQIIIKSGNDGENKFVALRFRLLS